MKRGWIFLVFALGSAIPAFAGSITYVCAGNVGAATCNYLNTAVAGNYTSTFTNANALIYIQYGTTGLASSTSGFYNFVTYAQYATALSAQAVASGNPVQIAAVTALTKYDDTLYGSDNISVTSALANALGISGEVQGGIAGTTGPGGSACNDPGTAGCYNGVITMTNAPNTWYYDNLGGAEPAADYDFYAATEHETDELLGTASCIGTQTGILVDNCDAVSGDTGGPSAVDLFRYNSAGSLALNSSYAGDDEAPAGAYFSYNGGTTNGAIGDGGSPKYYNTLANGDDYADFVSSSPCQANQAIQDAEGCPGQDAGLSILNDGSGEINILNAVGYDVASSVPEPGTFGPLGFGVIAFGVIGYRRCRIS